MACSVSLTLRVGGGDGHVFRVALPNRRTLAAE
jgi:hypothetical protein